MNTTDTPEKPKPVYGVLIRHDLLTLSDNGTQSDGARLIVHGAPEDYRVVCEFNRECAPWTEKRESELQAVLAALRLTARAHSM